MLAIADVAVTVKDARSSARWWEEKMGFRMHRVGDPDGHAWMVAPPGERFLLHLCEGIEPVDPGNTGIAFMTDELESQVRRMKAAGVKFVGSTGSDAGGRMTQFSDPDGNVFWLLGAPTSFIRQEVDRRANP